MKQDLTGRRFGRLKVIGPSGYKVKKSFKSDGSIGVRRYPMWECECTACGSQIEVLASSLLSGGTRSCGCLRREVARAAVSKLDPTAPRSTSTELVTTGDYMRRAREAARLTQEQLADKAKVARGTLARLERNNQTGNLGTIIQLADVLGLSIDEYVGRQLPERIG